MEVKVEDFKEVKVDFEEVRVDFGEAKVEGTKLECWCQCCALGKLLPSQPPFSSSLTRPGLPGEILLSDHLTTLPFYHLTMLPSNQ